MKQARQTTTVPAAPTNCSHFAMTATDAMATGMMATGMMATGRMAIGVTTAGTIVAATMLGTRAAMMGIVARTITTRDIVAATITDGEIIGPASLANDQVVTGRTETTSIADHETVTTARALTDRPMRITVRTTAGPMMARITPDHRMMAHTTPGHRMMGDTTRGRLMMAHRTMAGTIMLVRTTTVCRTTGPPSLPDTRVRVGRRKVRAGRMGGQADHRKIQAGRIKIPVDHRKVQVGIRALAANRTAQS